MQYFACMKRHCSARKWLNRLTRSSSGGSLPEWVLEGDFCQVLSHFFSSICDLGELGRRLRIKLIIQTTFHKGIISFKSIYLGGVHAGEAWLCPGEFLHICYRCSPEPHSSQDPEGKLDTRMTLYHRGSQWRLVSTRGSTNLSHLVLAPEAGIMKWSVSVFISCTSVCFKLDQLQGKTKQWIKFSIGPVRCCLVCPQRWMLILQTENRRFSPDFWNIAELLGHVGLLLILASSSPESDTLKLKTLNSERTTQRHKRT